jgi:hypothetical protein
MSMHQFFKRKAVDPQVAQQLRTITIPAPTRGLIMSENDSFIQPGAALVLDNWKPTMKGLALRGGCEKWSQLPETTSVISMFQYITANVQRLFAGNATKLYDVTAKGVAPTLVKSGQASGNYCASQLSNDGGDYLTVVNDAGDYPLRFDGTAWTTLSAGQIHTDPALPVPPTCTDGKNLSYVWKYRNRYFFIERNTMNAWYLPLNAIQRHWL